MLSAQHHQVIDHRSSIIEEMTCDDRGSPWAGLLWPIARDRLGVPATLLAAGICLAAAGCGAAPGLSPGPIGPVPWLSSKLGSQAETEALKKKVDADSFPSAAEVGVRRAH
jgi:hypothetical protein